jgi:CheY-like chemotaxis protein
MSRAALMGIPEDLGGQLAEVLRSETHQVTRRLYLQDLQRGPKPEVIFISGDNPDFPKLIGLLREIEPGLPVVVVTRCPGTGQWLDALEAGATDYCGAPFERVQLQWIMNTVALTGRQAA